LPHQKHYEFGQKLNLVAGEWHCAVAIAERLKLVDRLFAGFSFAEFDERRMDEVNGRRRWCMDMRLMLRMIDVRCIGSRMIRNDVCAISAYSRIGFLNFVAHISS
jgi:hypothetical protein